MCSQCRRACSVDGEHLVIDFEREAGPSASSSVSGQMPGSAHPARDPVVWVNGPQATIIAMCLADRADLPR
jgi:hypothetical protein